MLYVKLTPIVIKEQYFHQFKDEYFITSEDIEKDTRIEAIFNNERYVLLCKHNFTHNAKMKVFKLFTDNPHDAIPKIIFNKPLKILY